MRKSSKASAKNYKLHIRIIALLLVLALAAGLMPGNRAEAVQLYLTNTYGERVLITFAPIAFEPEVQASINDSNLTFAMYVAAELERFDFGGGGGGGGILLPPIDNDNDDDDDYANGNDDDGNNDEDSCPYCYDEEYCICEEEDEDRCPYCNNEEYCICEEEYGDSGNENDGNDEHNIDDENDDEPHDNQPGDNNNNDEPNDEEPGNDNNDNPYDNEPGDYNNEEPNDDTPSDSDNNNYEPNDEQPSNEQDEPTVEDPIVEEPPVQEESDNQEEPPAEEQPEEPSPEEPPTQDADPTYGFFSPIGLGLSGRMALGQAIPGIQLSNFIDNDEINNEETDNEEDDHSPSVPEMPVLPNIPQMPEQPDEQEEPETPEEQETEDEEEEEPENEEEEQGEEQEEEPETNNPPPNGDNGGGDNNIFLPQPDENTAHLTAWWYQDGVRRADMGYTLLDIHDCPHTIADFQRVQLHFATPTAADTGLWTLRVYMNNQNVNLDPLFHSFMDDYFAAPSNTVYVESPYQMDLTVHEFFAAEPSDVVHFSPILFPEEVNLNFGGHARMYMGFYHTHSTTPRELELWWYQDGRRRTDLGSTLVESIPVCTTPEVIIERVETYREFERYEYIESERFEMQPYEETRYRVPAGSGTIAAFDMTLDNIHNEYVELEQYTVLTERLVSVPYLTRQYFTEREYYYEYVEIEYECLCIVLTQVELEFYSVELTDEGEWTLRAFDGLYFYESPYVTSVSINQEIGITPASLSRGLIGFTPFSEVVVPVTDRQDMVDALTNNPSASPLVWELTTDIILDQQIQIPANRYVHVRSDNTANIRTLSTVNNRHFELLVNNTSTGNAGRITIGEAGNTDLTANRNLIVLQGGAPHGGHGGSITTGFNNNPLSPDYGARIVMWGGTIRGNSVTGTNRGGAIQLGHGASFIMHNGLITDNQSIILGGAISGQTGTTIGQRHHIHLYGGTITGNRQTTGMSTPGGSASGNGGGGIAMTGSGSTITIHGGAGCLCSPGGCSDIPVIISDNFAAGHGGGIYFVRANGALYEPDTLAPSSLNKLTIYGGIIGSHDPNDPSTGNIARGHGGGIFTYRGTNITIHDVTIRDNIAGYNPPSSARLNATGRGNGGGMVVFNPSGSTTMEYLRHSNIIIHNATITGNTARGARLTSNLGVGYGEGGGMYIGRNATLYIHNATISNNTAQNNGGGIATSRVQHDNGIINGVLTPPSAMSPPQVPGVDNTAWITVTIRNINVNNNVAGVCDVDPDWSNPLVGNSHRISMNLGGGIFLGHATDFTMHRGSIVENLAVSASSGSGGGIATEASNTLASANFKSGTLVTIYEADISRNVANGNRPLPPYTNRNSRGQPLSAGGGILMQGFHSVLTIFNNVVIADNEAAQGGGVALRDNQHPAVPVATNPQLRGGGVTFNMYGGQILRNYAFVDQPRLASDNSSQEGTYGWNGGGGVFLGHWSLFNMHAGQINHNRAYIRGGGVLLQRHQNASGTVFNMFGGEIAYNILPLVPVHYIHQRDGGNPDQAVSYLNVWGLNQLRGGGVLVTGRTSEFNMYGGEIHSNQAGYGAGVRVEFAGSIDSVNQAGAQEGNPNRSNPPHPEAGARFNFVAGNIRNNLARSTGEAGGGIGINIFTNLYLHGPGTIAIPSTPMPGSWNADSPLFRGVSDAAPNFPNIDNRAHPAYYAQKSPNRTHPLAAPGLPAQMNGQTHQGARIVGNIAHGQGGGIATFGTSIDPPHRDGGQRPFRTPENAVYRGARITMFGGEITHNASREFHTGNRIGGGGVYMSGTGTVFDMRGGVIGNNAVGHLGGGVRVNQGTFILNDLHPNQDATRIINEGILGERSYHFIASSVRHSIPSDNQPCRNDDLTFRNNLQAVSAMNINPAMLYPFFNTGSRFTVPRFETEAEIEQFFGRYSRLLPGTPSASTGVWHDTNANFYNNPSIRHNYAHNHGGGISLRPHGNLTSSWPDTPFRTHLDVHSGEIFRNITRSNGGGVNAELTVVNMDGGFIHWNTAQGLGALQGGGGIFMRDYRSRFNMSTRRDSTVTQLNELNETAHTGTAITPVNRNSLDFNFGTIANNTANSGGGLMLFNGQFRMHNGLFWNNEATGAPRGPELRNGIARTPRPPVFTGCTDLCSDCDFFCRQGQNQHCLPECLPTQCVTGCIRRPLNCLPSCVQCDPLECADNCSLHCRVFCRRGVAASPWVGGGGGAWINTTGQQASINMTNGTFLRNYATGDGGAIFANPTHAHDPLPTDTYTNVINTMGTFFTLPANYDDTPASIVCPHANLARRRSRSPSNHLDTDWWRFLTNDYINYYRELHVFFDFNGGWSPAPFVRSPHLLQPPGSHPCGATLTGRCPVLNLGEGCTATECFCCNIDRCLCDVHEVFTGDQILPQFGSPARTPIRIVPEPVKPWHVFLGWRQQYDMQQAYRWVDREVWDPDYNDGAGGYVMMPVQVLIYDEYCDCCGEFGVVPRMTGVFRMIQRWCDEAGGYIEDYLLKTCDDVRAWHVRYNSTFVAQWIPDMTQVTVEKRVSGLMANTTQYFDFVAVFTKLPGCDCTRNNVNQNTCPHPSASACLCVTMPTGSVAHHFRLRHGQTISLPVCVFTEVRVYEFDPVYYDTVIDIISTDYTAATIPHCPDPNNCDDYPDCLPEICGTLRILTPTERIIDTELGRDSGNHNAVFLFPERLAGRGDVTVRALEHGTRFVFTNDRDGVPPMSGFVGTSTGGIMVALGATLSVLSIAFYISKRRRRHDYQ